jgi:hypothetical protein
MTHNGRTVDAHERALRGVEPDTGGSFVIVYAAGALVFATGILVGYGLAMVLTW